MKLSRFFGCLMVIAASSAVLAQPQVPQPGTREFRDWEMRRQGMMRGEAWNVTGKIHSFNQRAAEINVVGDDGRNWRVKLGKDAPVSVKGEGSVELLQPRSAVRFYAKVTKRGLVTEPVAKLTSFTPRPPFQPMLEPATEEDALTAMAEEKEGEEGAADAEVPANESDEDPPTLQDRINAEDEKPKRGRAKRDKDSEEVAEGEWYHVTGILMSVKKGKFVIDAGEGGKLRGELAPDAKVEADFVGIQFAKPGDIIQAKGMTYPAQEMTATASTVDIVLTPKSPEEEDKPRRVGRGRNRKAEAEEQPLFGGAPEKP
jgi:hypothetical protein